MSDFQVTGGDQFFALSKALKSAGRTGLRKHLNKGLKEGAKPLIPLTRAAALAQLPKGGGLAKLVAKAPQRVQVRTGKTPGVRLVVGKTDSGARGANRGEVRHPFFGDRTQWFNQAVPAGWFDDTIKANMDKVLPALEQAMHDVIDEIVKGAK